MDQAEIARNIHYGRLEHEAELRLQLQLARGALEAATAYREHVEQPGRESAAGYLPTVAFGLTLAAAAPVGVLGATTVFVGLAIAGYGAAGSASYASQAMSRTFGWFPGLRNLGDRFDRYTILPEGNVNAAGRFTQ